MVRVAGLVVSDWVEGCLECLRNIRNIWVFVRFTTELTGY
jgi:hypothetical protein